MQEVHVIYSTEAMHFSLPLLHFRGTIKLLFSERKKKQKPCSDISLTGRTTMKPTDLFVESGYDKPLELPCLNSPVIFVA